jgi:pSer/pThr/pTyr-binding forkhead associated (FHA) protein
MIVCPNCNHPNPEGAVQCEACYTPLPATVGCPSCGATVQADASFCGQCGYNLRAAAAAFAPTVAPDIPLEVPPLVAPEPLVQAQPIVVTAPASQPDAPLPPTVVAAPEPQLAATEISAPPPSQPIVVAPIVTSPPVPAPEPEPVAIEPEPVAVEPEPVAIEPEPVAVEPELAVEPEPVASPPLSPSRTQLQQITAQLVHVQSDTEIELPQNLSVIHMGKPNDRIPPDVDVSGFSNSEIVSRIHADIRVEADAYYIEDVGSSNGTYINNLPLLPGNRHRLRPGDRISLGKGDLMTFLFQTVET